MAADVAEVGIHVLNVVVSVVPSQLHQGRVFGVLAEREKSGVEAIDAQVLLRREADILREYASELTRREAGLGGQIGQSHLGRVVGLDIGEDPHHPLHVDALATG